MKALFLVLSAALLLAACGDKPQSLGEGSKGATPWAGTGVAAFTAPGWKVGDKTGTAGDSGTANDIGVLWPQGGGAPVLVTCYLTRFMASPEQRDAAIAQVARAVAAARDAFTRA